MSSDALYQEMLLDLNELFDELGTSYQIESEGTYDSTTLTTSQGTSRSVVGIVADSTLSHGFAELTGERNWIGKKNLILRYDANPKQNEYVIVNGVKHPLNKIQTIKPANVVLIYVLDITR